MVKYDLCCIGYITQDKVVTKASTVYMPGGTAFYFAKAMRQLNAKSFLLVTAVSQRNMDVVDSLRGEGIGCPSGGRSHRPSRCPSSPGDSFLPPPSMSFSQAAVMRAFSSLPSKQCQLAALALGQGGPTCAWRLRGRRFRLAFRSRREQ